MRILPALAALLLFVVPAAAQAPSLPNVTGETRAAAQQLVEANGYAETAKTMLTLLRGQMVQMIQKGTAKPAVDVEKIVDEVLLPEMQSHMGELTAAIAEIYASNFTADEMRELVAFYATPIGKKMIKVSPKIGQQGFIAGQTWGSRVAGEAMANKAEELKQRGVQL